MFRGRGPFVLFLYVCVFVCVVDDRWELALHSRRCKAAARPPFLFFFSLRCSVSSRCFVVGLAAPKCTARALFLAVARLLSGHTSPSIRERGLPRPPPTISHHKTTKKNRRYTRHTDYSEHRRNPPLSRWLDCWYCFGSTMRNQLAVKHARMPHHCVADRCLGFIERRQL